MKCLGLFVLMISTLLSFKPQANATRLNDPDNAHCKHVAGTPELRTITMNLNGVDQPVYLICSGGNTLLMDDDLFEASQTFESVKDSIKSDKFVSCERTVDDAHFCSTMENWFGDKEGGLCHRQVKVTGRCRIPSDQ